MDKITKAIESWAIDKDLQDASPDKQVMKIGEEFGELCEGMVKGRGTQVIDSIGDIYIALTTLSLQLGISMHECIHIAFEEIKGRTGKSINGSFIKDADINQMIMDADEREMWG